MSESNSAFDHMLPVLIDMCEDLPDGFDPYAYDFENCQTRLDRNGPYHLQDVLVALFVSGGQITVAAAMLGRKSIKLRNYLLSNSDARDFRDEMTESVLDAVERSHNYAAITGDGAAQRFILSTLGKNRGYTTRVENTGKDGAPIQTENVDLTKLSDEQLSRLVDTFREVTQSTGT